jgi:hypothetical protein
VCYVRAFQLLEGRCLHILLVLKIIDSKTENIDPLFNFDNKEKMTRDHLISCLIMSDRLISSLEMRSAVFRSTAVVRFRALVIGRVSGLCLQDRVASRRS